jgi:diacylglycerol kinase family enzyme
VALARYVPKEYRITTGGTTIKVRALILSLANSAQFGNGARIAPAAKVDDGRLDLVVIPERSRLRTIGQLPRLFTGTVGRVPGCRLEQIADVVIEADEPMTYHVDGEPHEGGTQLRARVHPGALRVIV